LKTRVTSTKARRISHPVFHENSWVHEAFGLIALGFKLFHCTTSRKNALRMTPKDVAQRCFFEIDPSLIMRPHVKSKEVDTMMRKRNLISHQP
jgi:hypothetical protein